MIIDYNYMNNLLKNVIRPVELFPENCVFFFSDYVLSQTKGYPLLIYAYDRDINLYMSVLRYICTKNKRDFNKVAFKKVLGYFYSDLANALIKSSSIYHYSDIFTISVFVDKIFQDSEIETKVINGLHWKDLARILAKNAGSINPAELNLSTLEPREISIWD